MGIKEGHDWKVETALQQLDLSDIGRNVWESHGSYSALQYIILLDDS